MRFRRKMVPGTVNIPWARCPFSVFCENERKSQIFMGNGRIQFMFMKFSDFHDNYVKIGKWCFLTRQEAPKQYKRILFTLGGIHDFLVFLFFCFREIFLCKTQNFLKKLEFHRKSQKSLQAARWPKVFVFYCFGARFSSIFMIFRKFTKFHYFLLKRIFSLKRTF